MSFKKSFADIYEPYMKENGFVYNRKYGMFFRIVNDEIVQYFTYYNRLSGIKGIKSFTVEAGMCSMCFQSFERKWLEGTCLTVGEFSKIYGDNTNGEYEYCYNPQEEGSAEEAIRRTVPHTLKSILPVMSKVNDLNSYIEYTTKGRLDVIGGIRSKFYGDSFVLIKADNHNDFQKEFEESLEEVMQEVREGRAGGTYEEHYGLLYSSFFEGIVEPRDEIYNNPELYEKVWEEIRRREEANRKTLHDIGVLDSL